ncbi:immunoglobulin-like domain-containing protein [Aliarcobacter skirrowii]|uniref:immunoglobulin-like domain-containing protein n=6 Tax=Aliarcobacter skirrowii TaxID=28200 RepID=UPI001D178D14|nr:immunoglobulin-like domain-containing protein [Aliarcobacter skirrowii]
MASVARIADIRGLVSLNDGEEILKERDPISENGGILTISEFARIIFDDGREIEVQGPVQLTLNENFFQTGEFDIQNVQIENLNLVRDTVENLVTNIEGGTLPENPSEAFVATEQLDTLLENDEVISSTRSVEDDLAPTEPTPTEPTPTEPTPTEPTPTEPTPTEPTPTEPTPTEPTPTEPTPTEPTPTEPTPTEPTPTEPTPEAPVISIVGSTVTEVNTGEVTGNRVVGQVTISIDEPQDEDLTITLSNNQVVVIPKGETEVVANVETSRIDDAYKQGTTNETVSIKSTSNSEIVIENKIATITVKDDTDPVDVTITATVTTPKIIDVNTKTDGTTGVKVTGYNSDGKETDLSVIKGTNHDGFGVEGKNLSNGDTKELGVGEKIVVEFTNGKDVNSLDVSFAWRNNHETAKLTFVKGGQVVGYATVDGDGKSTTKAIVKYYDENNNLIKEVNAKGSSDKVDEAFTFELPDSNGGIVSFDKVEFSAPSNKDDYLINKIVYKEVIDPTVTNIETDGGNVTFNIQIDEKYPPQGKATATVEVDGKTYQVELNATGRGTLTIDSSKLGDLSKVEAKVIKVDGGNYEGVKSTQANFDFTPEVDKPTSSNDSISTNEDVAYALKVTDFGEVSTNTKEFKINELPTNGKLFLNITVGDTIFNPDGTKAVATQDSRVEITKDQIVTLGQVGAGKVVFEPTVNSDADGQFKFQVGDGNGNFSNNNYTTTIDVKAVADAPIVSIDITKIGATTNPSIEPTQKIGTTDSIKNIGTNGDDIIEVNKELVMNDNINLGNGNDTLILNKNINQVTIDLGNGNDKVVINGQVNGTNNIHLGNGDDVIVINNIVTNNTHINGGNGKDTLFLSGNKSDYIFNWQTNNNGMIEGSITDKKGGGTIQYNQMETIVFADGSYIGEKPQEEAPAQTIFKVDISAALTDTDGSETLSVVIKNVPEGATLESNKYEISNVDGSYTVKVPAGAKDISDSLTMKVPESYKGEINLQMEAKATEGNDTEDETNFAISSLENDGIFKFDGEGQINLNFDNISNLKEIDMTNGKENELNLDLKDLIKDPKEDSLIKILGDDKDSVTLKNSEGFEEQSSENDNSFVILSNGNLTLMIQGGLLDHDSSDDNG